MSLAVYCWLLWLYPRSYRHDLGEEMTFAFREARNALPEALVTRISFYRREYFGLLAGALCAHLDCLFGVDVSFRRFDMQPQFRFPRSTVFLMLVIFCGVVLAIGAAARVAGDPVGSGWQTVMYLLVFMLLSMGTVAAAVWGVLHGLRRSGVDRLENLQSHVDSAQPNGNP